MDRYRNATIACPSCSHQIVCGGEPAPDYDVFISHAHVDHETSDAICAALESRRYARCWIAPRDIAPGESFAGSIVRALRVCRVMVLVFSESSNRSDHVLSEVALARDTGVHIIPFRITDVTISDDLRFFLCVPQWIDAITKPLDGHLRRLVDKTRNVLDMAGTPPWLEPGAPHPAVRTTAPKKTIESDPLYQYARQLEDTAQFDELVRGGNLQSAMTVWLERIGQIERVQGGATHLESRGAERYYVPILRHLVPAIERTTVPGSMYPITKQLFQHMDSISIEQRIALFETVGEFLGPDQRNRLSGKERGLTALVQAYSDFDRSDIAYEIGARVIHRYPNALLLCHMTAAAAQMAAGSNPSLLSEAIRIERMAQAIPNAASDPNYSISSSVLAQASCGLARIRKHEGKLDDARVLLNQSIEKFEECLKSSRPPLRLALYAEALRDAGRLDEAFAAAQEGAQKNWFLREAQSIVIELGQSGVKGPRHLSELERHCRYWSIVVGEWPGSVAERKWSAMYAQYLIARKQYPEAVLRQPAQANGIPSGIRYACQTARQNRVHAAISVGPRSVRCSLDVWEPTADCPWFVARIPEVDVFGHGGDLKSAIEYLGQFLQLLQPRIGVADQVTPKLQQVRDWFRSNLSPDASFRLR